MSSFNLLLLPGLKPLLKNRWLLLTIRSLVLSFYIFAILVGFFGSSVGNRNFAIVSVWIVWWGVLMIIAVPLFGRAWCSICPIPLPGEWLQNRGVLNPLMNDVKKKSTRFPKWIRGIWVQNVLFSLLALLSAVILTKPLLTSWVLVALVVTATTVGVVYRRRSFCRYLCPVGGFIGIYSKLSPVELRVIDTEICVSHKTKTCYLGDENGRGCPWDIYPGKMNVNTNCGLCMECLQTCNYENIAINLRSYNDVTKASNIRLDESFKTFIMLGSVLVYSAVMLGPWGFLKMSAYEIGSRFWLIYAVGIVTLMWVVLPGIFILVSKLSQTLGDIKFPTLELFSTYSKGLLPIGMAAWMAFSVSFVLANISYLLPVLSDPFSWGWNLFNTASFSWTPYLSRSVPYLQLVLLMAGFYWSLNITRTEVERRKSPRHFYPVMLYNSVITLTLVWLMIA